MARVERASTRPKERPPLYESILRFQRDRRFLGPLLLVAGTVGLMVPILPGLLLLYLGLLLIRPSAAEALKRKGEALYRRVIRLVA